MPLPWFWGRVVSEPYNIWNSKHPTWGTPAPQVHELPSWLRWNACMPKILSLSFLYMAVLWQNIALQLQIASTSQASCTCNDCLQLFLPCQEQTIAKCGIVQAWKQSTCTFRKHGHWPLTSINLSKAQYPEMQVTFKHLFYDFSLLRAKRVMHWSSRQKSSGLNDYNINGLRQYPWLHLLCLIFIRLCFSSY